jgi:hypothetical protein
MTLTGSTVSASPRCKGEDTMISSMADSPERAGEDIRSEMAAARASLEWEYMDIQDLRKA